MTDIWTPEICASCTPHHVENCYLCFGFGLTPRRYPVAAGEAETTTEYIECPMCHGTPKGIASKPESIPYDKVGELKKENDKCRAK